jgi:hypothetical protein
MIDPPPHAASRIPKASAPAPNVRASGSSPTNTMSTAKYPNRPDDDQGTKDGVFQNHVETSEQASPFRISPAVSNGRGTEGHPEGEDGTSSDQVGRSIEREHD